MLTVLRGSRSGVFRLRINGAPEGARVVATYQNAVREFPAPVGGEASWTYSADETARFARGSYPLHVEYRLDGGERMTLENAGVQILVTDDATLAADLHDIEVGSADANPLEGVGRLGDNVTMKEIKMKLNEVITRLSAIAVLFALPLFGASVETAKIGDVPEEARVVTNVSLEGLATTADLAAATNSLSPFPEVGDGLVLADPKRWYKVTATAVDDPSLSLAVYTDKDLEALPYPESIDFVAYESPGGAMFCRFFPSPFIPDQDVASANFEIFPGMWEYRFASEPVPSDGPVLSLDPAATNALAAKADVAAKQDALPFTVGGGVKTYSIRASEAVKAYRDGNNEVIWSTYATKTEITNLATKAETSKLATKTELASAIAGVDVSSQLDPINAAIDAATNRVMVLDQNVQRMYVNSMASNVWFSVTNFDSVVHIPSLRMYEIRDGKIRIVWDEVTMHQRTLEAAIDAAAQMTAALAENMPSRAWGLVTSGSGAPAPANTTWVSSKKLVVAGEFEYKHVLTATDGMQFLCKMDGAEFGMNTNGMIRIEDGGGNVLFEIESKKVAIPDVRIKDVTVSPDGMSYAIHVQKQQGKDAELLEHPWLVVGDTLNTMLNETNSACLYNAQWTLANGVYTCNIWRKDGTRPPNGSFAKFVCDESNIGGGGGVMAKLNAPLKCQGVMSEDGTKTAKPVFNADGTVTWRWRD